LTNDPVSIHISPAGGFAPLEISVLPKMAIPAKLVRVLYDFDGDGIIDQTNTDLRLIRHTYTRAGDYYPMITAGYYGPKLASKLEGLSRSLTHVFSERTSVSAFSLTGSTREAARV